MAGRFVRQRKQAIARLRSIPQCGCKAGLYYDDGGKLTLGCHELGCDYLVFLRGRDWCAQCGYKHHTRGNPHFGSYWFACPKGHEHGSWFKWPTQVGSHGNPPLSEASGSAQSEAQRTPSHSEETYPDGTVRTRWELEPGAKDIDR